MRIRGKQAEALASEIAANPGKSFSLNPGSGRDIRLAFDGDTKPTIIGGRGRVERG